MKNQYYFAAFIALAGSILLYQNRAGQLELLSKSSESPKQKIATYQRKPVNDPVVTTPKKAKYSNSTAELIRLKKCAENENCNYPQIDPRSYEFALHHDVAQFLKGIQSSEYKDNKEVQKAFRDWMVIGNGFVQSVLLEKFAELEPTSEIVAAIIDGLKNNYHDPLIMNQALHEFSRYPNNQEVTTFIQETLKEGPHLSALEAAKNIRKVLTPENVSNYEKTIREVRSESVREALSASLKDYRFSLVGG